MSHAPSSQWCSRSREAEDVSPSPGLDDKEAPAQTVEKLRADSCPLSLKGWGQPSATATQSQVHADTKAGLTDIVAQVRSPSIQEAEAGG